MDTFTTILLLLILILIILLVFWLSKQTLQSHPSSCTPNKTSNTQNYETKSKLPDGWDMEGFNTHKSHVTPNLLGGVTV